MAQTIDQKAVENFLLANPNFLQERPSLLAALSLPHGGPDAISLVERQVAVLRENNVASRKKLAQLSEISRENERLLEATRVTILALLKAPNAGGIRQIWCEQAILAFGSEHAALHWFERSGVAEQAPSPAAEILAKKLIKNRNSISGSFRLDEMQALFGNYVGEGSAAIGGLFRGDDMIGLVSVGSNDKTRYRPDDGTLFLDYLAEVISQLPEIRPKHEQP